MSHAGKHLDSDAQKGAVESQSPEDAPSRPDQHSSLAAQLPHRVRHTANESQADREIDEEIKDNDTDFPEPGPNEEHTGQHK